VIVNPKKKPTVLAVAEGGWNGNIQEKNYRALLELDDDEKIQFHLHHFFYCYFSVSFWFRLINSDTVIIGIGPLHPLTLPAWAISYACDSVIVYTSWWDWKSGRWAYSTPLDWIVYRATLSLIRRGTTVAITSAVSEQIRSLGGNSVTIPHSVDTGKYKPMNVDSDMFTALYVGRMEYRKGVDRILRLAERDNDIKVQLAGKGPMREQVKKHTKATYLGYLSLNELVKAYSKASVLLLPSRNVGDWNELFGIVLIEAMACGTPVISTDCPGPEQIISPSVGKTVPQDSNSIVRGLEQAVDCIRRSSTVQTEMSNRARERALEEFSISTVSSKWNNLLSKID